WPEHPPAAAIGARFAADAAAGLRAAWLTGALIGIDCARAGFDVVCAPVLDLGLPGAHSVIGDRAFGPDPRAVARLGRAMADGLLAAGVQPVGKHAPGHGRALADSHAELPVVDTPDLAADFLPFAANADLPWLMTAHIVYASLDPGHPATLSSTVIARMLRGRFRFDGVLVSDDLSMRALAGPPAASARAAIAAGCDLALYGAGDFVATEALLAACPALRPSTSARLAAAASLARSRAQALDGDRLGAERDRLLT
ncbi:MAG: glycoside hydrolase family 3 N-terminal domain-containing protein, partial [Acetobacteraceae bacterium]